MVQIDPSNVQPVRMSSGRKIALSLIWSFPYVLAATAYCLGTYYSAASSLRSPVFDWPIPESVYLWLLLLVLAAVVWLVGEFISVTSRETVVSALQLDAAFSAATAMLFSAFAGYFIGIGGLEWWFVVPWIATVIDALTAAILSVNNAAQKPFLSKHGTS